MTAPRLACAAMLGVLVAACATPPMPRELSDAFDGARVRLTPAQELIVNLDGNQTTGFRWSLTRNIEPFVVQVGEPVYTQRASEGRLQGTGGVTTFRFKGGSPGEAQLVFAYRRPWEVNLPPAKIVRFDVRVE
jgi:inhibitor of cysteine peptidase